MIEKRNKGLNLREACEQLGCSYPTISAYIHRKENPLPCIVTAGGKRGRYIIPANALDRWMDEEAARCAGSTR